MYYSWRFIGVLPVLLMVYAYIATSYAIVMHQTYHHPLMTCSSTSNCYVSDYGILLFEDGAKKNTGNQGQSADYESVWKNREPKADLWDGENKTAQIICQRGFAGTWSFHHLASMQGTKSASNAVEMSDLSFCEGG